MQLEYAYDKKLTTHPYCMVLLGQQRRDPLIHGHHFQEISPQCHEQRAQLCQIHVHQFSQLIWALCSLLQDYIHTQP